MKAAFAVIMLAAVACSAPESIPTPRPTYTPYPTYTPAAAAAPGQTPTSHPTSVAASADFTVHTTVDPERFSGAAADALHKGKRQFANGEYRAAIYNFKEAQRLHGKPSSFLERYIGLAYDGLGQYDIAIEHLSNAIAINDDAGTRVNRAYSYSGNAQCEPAISDALAALAKEPEIYEGYNTDAEANFVLGWCYYEQSKYLQSLQHADAAIAIANDHQYAESEMAGLTELRDAIRQELNR